jgi:hypothetical protein
MYNVFSVGKYNTCKYKKTFKVGHTQGLAIFEL